MICLLLYLGDLICCDVQLCVCMIDIKTYYYTICITPEYKEACLEEIRELEEDGCPFQSGQEWSGNGWLCLSSTCYL
jgi:hypothetical protein